VLIAIVWAVLGGIKKHLALVFFGFIQLFYLLFTPFVKYLNDDYFAFNVLLGEDDFFFGLLILGIHLVFFYTGYFTLQLSSSKASVGVRRLELSKNRIMVISILFMLIIGINSAFGEVSLIDILIGKEEDVVTLGFKGGSNWFSNLADSLIILVCMYYFVRTPKFFNVFAISFTICLFLILGFRYRFLLLFFGFFLMYLKKTRLTKIFLFKALTIGFFSFYTFMFISENRINFYTNNLSNLNYSLSNFDYSSIGENTMGTIVDFALIRSCRNESVVYDFGESMFVYPFIMIMPSSFFHNGEKPYPAPQINAIDKALNVPRSYGQACTFVGMSYYAFSWFGVVVFSFLFGMLANSIEFKSDYSNLSFKKLSILLASFQLYTRGYLGLFLLPLSFMLIAIFLVELKLSKSSARKS
jgi:hypothetical protein